MVNDHQEHNVQTYLGTKVSACNVYVNGFYGRY